MGLKRVSWVHRFQGQCRALRPLGHQGYRLRSYNKDQPLCSGYKNQTPTRNPQNGNKGGKGGGKGGRKGGPPNPQRRSSAPAATPPPAEGDPKKRPQGNNASPEGNKSKKRRLAWMAKSIRAAGVDVKFPAEE